MRQCSQGSNLISNVRSLYKLERIQSGYAMGGDGQSHDKTVMLVACREKISNVTLGPSTEYQLEMFDVDHKTTPTHESVILTVILVAS